MEKTKKAKKEGDKTEVKQWTASEQTGTVVCHKLNPRHLSQLQLELETV